MQEARCARARAIRDVTAICPPAGRTAVFIPKISLGPEAVYIRGYFIVRMELRRGLPFRACLDEIITSLLILQVFS